MFQIRNGAILLACFKTYFTRYGTFKTRGEGKTQLIGEMIIGSHQSDRNKNKLNIFVATFCLGCYPVENNLYSENIGTNPLCLFFELVGKNQY